MTISENLNVFRITNFNSFFFNHCKYRYKTIFIYQDNVQFKHFCKIQSLVKVGMSMNTKSNIGEIQFTGYLLTSLCQSKNKYIKL